MKFLVVIIVYQFFDVFGIHDQVHHTTMRTVYEVQLDHFELLHNTETVFQNIDIRIKKFNRTTYILMGSFDTVVEFSDDFSAQITFSALQGNEYKVIVPSKDYDKLCTFLATEKMVYPEILEHSNFPQPGACPTPMGSWRLNDYAGQNKELPELPSAGEKWKYDIMITYKGVMVGHAAVYAIVKAKRVRVSE